MLTKRISRLARFLGIITILTLIIYLLFRRNKLDEATEVKSRETKERLAVVVPFRDRFDELLLFVPLLTDFLVKQHIQSFRFYIINQSSRYRFNRGALINVGFLLARNTSDYIAIHDVDLIPLNQNLSYSYPSRGPYHLASPDYHPQYNYSKYLGGILLISNQHFELVNGMSNRYFGWGLEDDEFYTRIRAAQLPVERPANLLTDRRNTFLHFHYNRKRDTFKTAKQREILSYRDRTTGISNIDYNVTNRHELAIDRVYSCTVFDVEIGCDKKLTPWCIASPTKRVKPIQST